MNRKLKSVLSASPVSGPLSLQSDSRAVWVRRTCSHRTCAAAHVVCQEKVFRFFISPVWRSLEGRAARSIVLWRWEHQSCVEEHESVEGSSVTTVAEGTVTSQCWSHNCSWVCGCGSPHPPPADLNLSVDYLSSTRFCWNEQKFWCWGFFMLQHLHVRPSLLLFPAALVAGFQGMSRFFMTW